jgi:hypothetical protein
VSRRQKVLILYKYLSIYMHTHVSIYAHTEIIIDTDDIDVYIGFFSLYGKPLKMRD